MLTYTVMTRIHTKYCVVYRFHVGTNTHTHTHAQGAMLSPNVINAVKWLTSGYLFKSRHQTHSFFSFYLHRSQKLLSGEKRRPPFGSAASTVDQTRPALSAQRPRSLSSFTEGACRASAVLCCDKAAQCHSHNGQWGWKWQWTHCEGWCHQHQTLKLLDTKHWVSRSSCEGSWHDG